MAGARSDLAPTPSVDIANGSPTGARHFREAESLSIAEIAARLDRSPATVKAYFYDPREGAGGQGRAMSASAAAAVRTRGRARQARPVSARHAIRGRATGRPRRC